MNDAIEMYQIAIDGYGKVLEDGCYQILKAEYALGSACMKIAEEERPKDVDVEKLFQKVLSGCKWRKSRRNPEEAPGSRNGEHRSTMETQISRHQDNERDWRELEFDTIGDLTLLYADQGDLAKAAKTYVRAIKRFGEPLPSKDVEAFVYHTDTYATQPFGERKKRNEGMGFVYQRAFKQFNSILRRGSQEHALTLITILNRGINLVLRERERERETEKLLRDAYDGLKCALGKEHAMVLIAAHHLAVLLDKRGVEWKEAGKLHQIAIEGFEKRLSNNNHDNIKGITDCMVRLGLGNHYLLLKEPKKDEARPKEDKACPEDKAREQFELVENFLQYPQGLCDQNLYNRLRHCAKLGTARTYMKTKSMSAKEILKDVESKLQCANHSDLDLCQTSFLLGQLYEDDHRKGKQYEGEHPLWLAEAAYKKSRRGYRHLIGPDSPLTLSVMKRLGRVRVELGKHLMINKNEEERKRAKGMTAKAEKIFCQAFESYQSLYGSLHPPTLRLASHLGLTCLELQNYEKAARLCKLARDGLVKACGEDDHTTIKAERALGLVYLAQWQLPKARKSADRVLKWCQQQGEKQNWMHIDASAEMGTVYEAEENLEDAKKMYKKARVGYSKIQGLHGALAGLEMEMKLGNLYRRQNKSRKAELIARSAIQRFQKIKPRGGVGLARAKILLAHILMDREGAMGILKEMSESLDKDHPLYIDAIAVLGSMEPRSTAEVDQKETYLREALRGYEAALVPGHVKTKNVMDLLSRLYRSLGRKAEAEAMDKRKNAIDFVAETVDDRAATNNDNIDHGIGQATKSWGDEEWGSASDKDDRCDGDLTGEDLTGEDLTGEDLTEDSFTEGELTSMTCRQTITVEKLATVLAIDSNWTSGLSRGIIW